MQIPCSQARAIWTGAIPLGKATPGRGAEDSNAHANSELEFSVGVGADFAVQANIFVLGRCPFHRYVLLHPNGSAATARYYHEKETMQRRREAQAVIRWDIPPSRHGGAMRQAARTNLEKILRERCYSAIGDILSPDKWGRLPRLIGENCISAGNRARLEN